MVQRALKRFTAEEYLAQEEVATTRSEYYRGQIYAMSGGTPNHNTIVSNVGGELRQALRRKPCQSFVADQRLLVNQNGLYTYPDAMVVCGEVQLAPGQRDTLVNPVLIVEVLSDATRGYDCGEKFKLNRAIPTLQHYILVDQASVQVEYYRKHNNEWIIESYMRVNDAFIVKLNDGEVKLRLRDLYDKVDFEA